MKQLIRSLTILVLFYVPAFSQIADSTIKTVPTSQIPSNATHFTVKQLYPPAALMLSGFIANGSSSRSIKNWVQKERNKQIPNFRTHLDDYLQFAPLAAAYGLDAFGVKSKTDFLNRSVILVKGEVLALGTTMILKRAFHNLRPDGSTYNSLPSGHTTQAFAAATFLSEEYKDTYPWMPYASYTVASSIGLMRVANNRHYISDVLLGAGIGLLSMKVAYWTHRYKWGKKQKTVYR